MLSNHSPWLHQLNRTRPIEPLTKDASADVAIVGGGIAGVMTAYFTLRDTSKSVLMVEADKVAHGATGHNAGQIASYFERPFAELVEEFGLQLAADGQRSVESGWALLDSIILEAGLATPVHRFTGYAGCMSLAQVLAHLRDNQLRVEGGLPAETMTIAEEWIEGKDIPEEFSDLYQFAPQRDILALLNTNNPVYIAALSYQKGCTNSALICEEIVEYLLATYPDRFQLHEGTEIKVVRLQKEAATLQTANFHTVTAERVVLCTNGFEYFTLVNEAGADIDTSFHHLMSGRIGYMAGYLEPMDMPPTAISYFQSPDPTSEDPTGESYYYLTRRPHSEEGSTAQNLVCIGGPDSVLPNQALYERDMPFAEDRREEIDGFMCGTYVHHPVGTVEYAFTWHGLMGYTPNGVRRVGTEPKNPVLLYNLGCNGVGILPSIYGGKRIATILSGRTCEPSIFDPV